jgi:phage gpG-like protein
MTPEEFNQNMKRLAKEYKEFFDKYAPAIAGREAVKFFKQNFQNEAWGHVKWKEVKRRQDSRNYTTITRGKNKGKQKAKGAWVTAPILTRGGELGRSIEVKEIRPGEVIIWTDPGAFKSKEPYGRVHNEGLKAGRGKGFTMPKRQFMGEHPELNKIIIEKLEEKLKSIMN